MIYFDNAASSYPKPQSVVREVRRWISVNGANPGRSGHKPAIDAATVVFDTRCEIADMFGVSAPENVAFVPNATYGLNMLLQGLLFEGDHAVTTEFEHNSVLRPLHFMSMIRDVRYDIASVDMYDDERTVENILSKIRSNTRLVVCTQCSNVCGKVMPIKRISERLPESVLLVVDGSQGAGIISTNMSEDGIDYYCAPSHKGLLGLQGSGFIAVNGKIPVPIITGGTGSDSSSLVQPSHMPDAFESGTLSTPSILSMKLGMEYIKQKGIEKIYSHKKRLTEYLYTRLSEMERISLYADPKYCELIGVLSFNVLEKSSDEVAFFLSSHGICVRSGLHCAPLIHKKFGTTSSGAVRVSFNSFNTIDEIDQFIKTMNKYLKK